LVTTRGSESICLTNFVAPAPIMNEEASALAASNAVELSSRDVAILGATRGLVCKAGRVFQVDAFGMTYAVCMVNGLPKTVYGDEVTISLSNWRTGAIQMPTTTDCIAVDAEQRRLDEISSVDGHDMSSVNEFWWRETVVERSAASKKCGFVHGLGGDSSGWNKKKPKGVGWQTNKCKKRTYLNWPATTWQWKVWWQRVGVKNQVNDKDIIFAHSMGNVMMIRCGTNGGGYAGWYDLDGPVTGAESANFADDTCSLTPTGFAIVLAQVFNFAVAAIETIILWAIAQLLGNCDGFSANTSCRSLRTSELRGATYSSSQDPKGALCGYSQYGLTSWQSPKFVIFGTIAGLPGADDGAVPYSYSCNEVGPGFSKSKYKKKWYKSKTNHSDGPCRSGNGWWGKHRQPMKWVQKWDNYDTN